jgi:hypothetical protein
MSPNRSIGRVQGGLSLPKSTFERTDDVGHLVSPNRSIGVCRARPSRAKHAVAPRYNRWRISQEFVEGAPRGTRSKDRCTRAGLTRSSVQHIRSAKASGTRFRIRFGFINPILIDRNKRIIAGHGRWEAAKSEGHSTVPTILLEHLTEDQRRAYIIADNRLAEKAGWDKEILEIELHLVTVGFNVEVTGFEVPEVDLILDAATEKEQDPGPEDDLRYVRHDQPAVTRPGDLWLLVPNDNPRHRLLSKREPGGGRT